MQIEFYKNLSYPTSVEEKVILDEFPEIRKFRIPSELINFETEADFEGLELKLTHDAWFNRLRSKLSDVVLTYILVKHNFKKGIPDDEWQTLESDGSTSFFKHFTKAEHEINKIMFDYYSEYFFYLYFSFADILHKVINIRYKPQVVENDRRFNEKVLKELSLTDNTLSMALDSHHKNTVDQRDSRNKMTHAFSELDIDLRPIITYNGTQKITHVLDAQYTQTSVLLRNIEKLIINGIVLLEQVNLSFLKR